VSAKKWRCEEKLSSSDGGVDGVKRNDDAAKGFQW
jgi:hypothetical protein